jgi:hypothetical protein
MVRSRSTRSLEVDRIGEAIGEVLAGGNWSPPDIELSASEDKDEIEGAADHHRVLVGRDDHHGDRRVLRPQVDQPGEGAR